MKMLDKLAALVGLVHPKSITFSSVEPRFPKIKVPNFAKRGAWCLVLGASLLVAGVPYQGSAKLFAAKIPPEGMVH